jgi:uncharacterized protein
MMPQNERHQTCEASYNAQLERDCIEHFQNLCDLNDPSHDPSHTSRVLEQAKRFAIIEHASLSVVIPAAVFHDVVNYRKDDPRSGGAVDESAAVAETFLRARGCSESACKRVGAAIRTCSFSRGIRPTSIEGMVVKDADLLEQSGAIAIMRTFASCGQMNRSLFDRKDPFAQHRPLSPSEFGLDLFEARLLRIREHLSTEAARITLDTRERFLLTFVDQLRQELRVEETSLPRGFDASKLNSSLLDR